MRAAIYARKSPHDDPKQDSVDRQVAHSRAYALEKDWIVDNEHIYVDDNISGGEFQNRPGLLRLLNSAAKRPRPFDVVVMMELERLGRDRLRTELVARDLHDAGIRIFYYLTDDEQCVDTAEARFVMAARGFSAEMEREKAKQRTRDALSARARRGFVTGGVVSGYRNIPIFLGTDSSGNPIRSHVELAIDVEQSQIVRAIFQMRADSYGVRAIARALNGDPRYQEENARYFGGRRIPPPRKGSGSWAPGCLHAILRNERYIGRLTWGRFRNTDKGGRTRIRVKQCQDSWVQKEASHLQIVEPNIWERVRAMDRKGDTSERQTGRGRNGTSKPTASLLSGISACGSCNGPIAISGSRRRVQCYGCSYRRNRGSTVCSNDLLESVPLIDQRIIEEIEALLLVPAARRYTVERAISLIKARVLRCEDLVQDLRTSLANVDREVRNLVRAIESGEAPQVLIERLRERDQERENLRNRVLEEERLSRLPDLDERRINKIVEKGVAGLGDMLRGDTVMARTALRKILAGRVTFTPSTTENGERTYVVEAPLTLGRLIATPAMQNTESVPDGI